jgi:hypothetical protein
MNECVGVSNRRLVNLVIACPARMVSKKDKRVYIGSSKMSLRPVRATCALAVEVTNGRERDWASKSLVECAGTSVSLNFSPPSPGSLFPFYQSKGREWIQRKKREEERERKRGPRDRAASPTLRMGLLAL